MKCGARLWRTVSADKPSRAIDKNSSRADFGGFSKEHAVGLLQFLPQYVASGEDDFQTALPFELFEIPAEPERVAQKLVRRYLKKHNHAGFIKLVRATIHELHTKGRFAGAYRAFYQNHVTPRNSASQNAIETGNTSPDQIR